VLGCISSCVHHISSCTHSSSISLCSSHYNSSHLRLHPTIFALCIVLLHACRLPPVTCMLLVVTLHMHMIPPMTSMLHVVTLCMHGIPPMTFVLHVVTLHALYPLLEPFVHHMNCFCCVTSNLGGACATFLIFPSTL
jgi:hypothetical protein